MITKQKLEIKNYKKIAVTPRFCYFQPKAELKSTIAQEISYSLSQKNKFIHPKFFYDEAGSDLFEKICSLPEYYLTRTEIEILSSIKSELSKYLVGDYALVELGSGSSIKTRKLLKVLTTKQNDVEYYPIDISNILKDSSINLHDEYDNLKITGIIDQYETGLEFIRQLDHKEKLVAFLGSSLGNFDPENGIEFLKKIRFSMRKGDLFLLGIDLVKDAKILENAYDDSSGVTAEFNLNLLSRINRELDATFDHDKFEHVAIFNKRQKRIEMYLKSKVKHQVFVSAINLLLKFKKGELIHTEYSYKYTIPQIKKMAQKTGFKPVQIWKDKKNYFAVVLFSVYGI
ncbi:MAG: L-histidine N(alpha)-methyltransferase [Thaumarchaeota archaeon]|nr:L-histidine N(alpha)-methyltransferase [Nitrososphaerota archaeon]